MNHNIKSENGKITTQDISSNNYWSLSSTQHDFSHDSKVIHNVGVKEEEYEDNYNDGKYYVYVR